MHYAIDVVTKLIYLYYLFMNDWRIVGNEKDCSLFRRISTSQIHMLKIFIRHIYLGKVFCVRMNSVECIRLRNYFLTMQNKPVQLVVFRFLNYLMITILSC